MAYKLDGRSEIPHCPECGSNQVGEKIKADKWYCLQCDQSFDKPVYKER